MDQRLRPRWRVVTERIGPLGVVAAFLAVLGLVILVLAYTVPAFVGSVLLQVLGAATLGAGLSALVGAVTGREAIHQQSAREANLARKRDTYGPLYAELKALRGAFAEAETGTAPFPQRIDNGVEVKRGGVAVFSPRAPGPTLQCWPEFRHDYRDTDFTPSAQNLLDELQALATTYNNDVEAAREPAIGILAAHADTAVATLRQSDDYKQWQEHDAKLKANPPPLGHAPKTPRDWYGYVETSATRFAAPFRVSPGRQLAAMWLGSWPSPYQSQALGWLLAGHPDKAAEYVQRNYPSEGNMEYPPPPLDWIRDMFLAAWPELQQAPTFRAAAEAGATLFGKVKTAEETLAAGLRRIQDQYEGGAPLV